MRDARRGQVIDIWKSIVEVQRHFNDISMRIRGLFITLLLATFASIGFLLDKNLSLKFGYFDVKFVTFVPLFGIVGACLFYFMDRYWYHRLLVGSVQHAIAIENMHKKDIPELSLSAAIGEVSAYQPGRMGRWLANLLVAHEKYRQTGKLHSDGKIELFYKSVMLVLALTTILLALAGGVVIEKDKSSNNVAPDKGTIRIAPTALPWPTVGNGP